MIKPIKVQQLSDLRPLDKVMLFEGGNFKVYTLFKNSEKVYTFIEERDKTFHEIDEDDYLFHNMYYLSNHSKWLKELLRYKEWMNAMCYNYFKKNIESYEKEAEERGWSLELDED